MTRTKTKALTTADLEQLYSEIENRVEKKWSTRFEQLERELERVKQDRDLWQERYYKEQEVSRQLLGKLELAQAENRALKVEVEKLQARIKELEKELYGRRNEASKDKPALQEREETKRSRGRQKGAKGHGRKIRTELEPIDCIHEIALKEKACNSCGAPYADMGEQVSEEIDVEYKLVRLVHRRKKACRTCNCRNSPMIKIAPGPVKLDKGGMLTTDFWAYILFEKFQLQRPVNRQLQLWKAHGLQISHGTITQGLKRLHEKGVFAALVVEIKSRIKNGNRQKSDETGWKVFQEVEGKDGYQHWLWATLGKDACLFRVAPNRSRAVAKEMIGDHPTVLTSDRYSAYHNLGDNVTNSWCWAHIRREFIKIQSIKSLKSFGERWLSKVDNLYHLNNMRLADSGSDFDKYDALLRIAVAEFERQLKSNAKRSGMHVEARKLCKNIASDWPGLIVFVDLPEISMDNNESERAVRNPVIGRKNYYGSGSQWSANLTADLFSIFATLGMNKVNIIDWLRKYLKAVADAGGKTPENFKDFLPWQK